MKKLLTLGCLLGLFLQNAFSMTGLDIMNKVDAVKEPNTVRNAIKLEIIGSDGEIKERLIESWGMKSSTGSDMTVMVFRAPASVKNTRFLTLEVKGHDDDQWLYLPALGKVRRIVSGDGNSSFMGTEFTYDDMASRDVDEDTHTLIGEERVGEYDCWIVESVPVDKKDSAYSKVNWWIIKTDNMLIPLKADLFDRKGKLKKQLFASEIINRDGYWTADKVKMVNVQNNRASILTTIKSKVDGKVNPKYFTKRYLSTGKVKK